MPYGMTQSCQEDLGIFPRPPRHFSRVLSLTTASADGLRGSGRSQRTFKICKPYLVNAPQEDLLLLVETLLSRPDGSVSSVGSSIQGARLLLDYCRESGTRDYPLRLADCSAIFG